MKKKKNLRIKKNKKWHHGSKASDDTLGFKRNKKHFRENMIIDAAYRHFIDGMTCKRYGERGRKKEKQNAPTMSVTG